jgi:hypothetical protein
MTQGLDCWIVERDGIVRLAVASTLCKILGSCLTINIVSVSCAKGYDCCVRFEVRTSRKTLYLPVVLRDMIVV